MSENIISLFTAFTGSLGFALLFRTRRRLLLPAAFGGLLSWTVFLLTGGLHSDSFTACLAGACFAALYSELLARLMKAPAIIFFIPAVIPLIPGGALYHTMDALIHGKTEDALFYGSRTGLDMLAIAVGMSLVNAVIVLETRLRASLRTKSRPGQTFSP